MAFLEYERDGGIVTLAMNEPASRNALTRNSATGGAVAAAASMSVDPAVRVAIFTRAGPIFS